jgi:hypothetical protein
MPSHCNICSYKYKYSSNCSICSLALNRTCTNMYCYSVLKTKAASFRSSVLLMSIELSHTFCYYHYYYYYYYYYYIEVHSIVSNTNISYYVYAYYVINEIDVILPFSRANSNICFVSNLGPFSLCCKLYWKWKIKK